MGRLIGFNLDGRKCWNLNLGDRLNGLLKLNLDVSADGRLRGGRSENLSKRRRGKRWNRHLIVLGGSVGNKRSGLLRLKLVERQVPVAV